MVYSRESGYLGLGVERLGDLRYEEITTLFVVRVSLLIIRPEDVMVRKPW
jgi:hypothetical protein